MKPSEEVQIHKGCNGLVRNVGFDGISYCEDCEHICEGETEYVTEEEYEERQEAADFKAGALRAGIPLSVIEGKSKLTDHFSREYIAHQTGATTYKMKRN